MRIDLRVDGDRLVYDAAVELPLTPPVGLSRGASLASLTASLHDVAKRVEDSRREVENGNEDAKDFEMQESVSSAPLQPHPLPLKPLQPTPLQPTPPVARPYVEPPAPLGQSTSSTLLTFVLLVGGACVFLGILALAVTRWSAVGPSGQLGMIAAFTAATFATGRWLARRAYARSGFALELLSLELLWVVAHVAIGDPGSNGQTAWIAPAVIIAIVHAGFAAWRRSTAVAVSSAVALAAATALIGMDQGFASAASAFVFAGLVAGLFGAVAEVAARLDCPAVSRPYAVVAAVVAVGSALAMTVLLAGPADPGDRALQLLWPYVALSAGAFLGRRRVPSSSTRVILVTVGALLPSAQAILLGALTQPYWVAAVTIAPLSFFMACGFARWLAPRDGAPATVAAFLSASWIAFSVASALASFVVTGDASAASWPFVMVASAWGGSAIAHRIEGAAPVARALRVVTGLCLLVAPSVIVLAAPWGDAPRWAHGAALLAASAASLLLSEHVLDRAARRWSLPLASVAAAWGLLTSGAAVYDLHEKRGPIAAMWPFLAAAFVWGLARAVGERREARTSATTTSLAPKALRSAAGLLLLVAPSADVLALDWTGFPFWVRGLAAMAATALAGFVGWWATRDRAALDGAHPESRKAVLVPFALVGGLWALDTTKTSFAEVASQSGYLSVAVAWPYLMALGVYAFSAIGAGGRRASSTGNHLALAIACGAASFDALVAHDRFGFLLLAVAIGCASVLVSLHHPTAEEPGAVSEEPRPMGLGVVLGSVTSVLVPGVLAVAACFGHDPSSTGSPEALRVFVTFLASLATLFAIAYTRPVHVRSELRTLDVGLSAAFVGVVGLLAIPNVTGDVFYMATFFTGGVALVALGLVKRRVVLVGFASVALLVELFVQYFAKLSGHVHWGLLALGFGVGLLGLAIIFERKVKPHLPELARWS